MLNKDPLLSIATGHCDLILASNSAMPSHMGYLGREGEGGREGGGGEGGREGEERVRLCQITLWSDGYGGHQSISYFVHFK